ncbi:hypothetical protein [Methanoregula sp.]|uniref:hypothetical protein n=1 Tax=Methanoregula sp. TaxID=2052170 RepID=UPI0026073AA5|nr:hypothetical protein [Methanoregula sp.]MDD5144175.1 hypothetical protein [Methanoregula sp.]
MGTLAVATAEVVVVDWDEGNSGVLEITVVETVGVMLFSDAGMDMHPAENREHTRRMATQTIGRTGVNFFIIIRKENEVLFNEIFALHLYRCCADKKF